MKASGAVIRRGLDGAFRSRVAWLVVAAVLAAWALGLGASTALARATPPPCFSTTGQVPLTPTSDPLGGSNGEGGSNFQGGDGNQADPVPPNGWIDWQGLLKQDRVVSQTDPNSPGPNDDSMFTSGSKECNPGGWTLTFSSVTSDDDILDVYRSFEHETGHDAFLYLAFTRYHGSGTSLVNFELNQAMPRRDQIVNGQALPIPCRQNGDLLISFIQQGNKTGDTYAYVNEWVTDPGAVDPYGCATTGHLQPVTGLDPKVDVQAAYNAGTIDRFLPGQCCGPSSDVSATKIDTGGFGEAAINLTTVLAKMGEPCSDTNYRSIWAHSRASVSDTSEMKDYVAPQGFLVRNCKAHPRLPTQHGAVVDGALATPVSVPLGTQIFDTAGLGPPCDPAKPAEANCADHPTGTITFRVYGPDDTGCTGDPAAPPSVVKVTGAGRYHSALFRPTHVGTYRWRVEYSGDANNAAVEPTQCGAPSETIDVTRLRPTITTVASDETVFPNPIHDKAYVTSPLTPTGTVTFDVFSPSDASCSMSPAHTFHDVPLVDGTATSPDFTPTEAGTWRWIATYSGDRHNTSVHTDCNDMGESVVVDPPTAPPTGKPAITTTATAGAPAGAPIMDSANLTGGTNPTGTITFYVYGADDSTCTGAPAAPPSTATVMGAGVYTSAPFTPTDPGTYRWVADYSGDANNDPAATSCNDSGESSVVSKATPAITTSASPTTAPYGSAVGDTAVLTGGADPTGTITFRLYGPNDDSCSGPPTFVVEQEVTGNGSYPSPLPTPTLAGTHHWVATYSGDSSNDSVSTHCGDPGESVVVEAPPPIHPAPEGPTPKPKPKPKPKHKHKPKPKPKPPAFTG